MKNLKDLTPDECVKIATIAEPNVTWKFIESSCKWTGFDLISIDDDLNGVCHNIFQIDYHLKLFRVFHNLEEFSIPNDKIELISKYLIEINEK